VTIFTLKNAATYYRKKPCNIRNSPHSKVCDSQHCYNLSLHKPVPRNSSLVSTMLTQTYAAKSFLVIGYFRKNLQCEISPLPLTCCLRPIFNRHTFPAALVYRQYSFTPLVISFTNWWLRPVFCRSPHRVNAAKLLVTLSVIEKAL
jgi:hypothetical protein